MYFLREDGAWRLDLARVLEGADALFAPGPVSALSEDDFVIFIVERVSGRPVSPRIWQPVQ